MSLVRNSCFSSADVLTVCLTTNIMIPTWETIIYRKKSGHLCW